MATAPNLPTNVAAGAPGHAALHNDVNASVNQLRLDVDDLSTSIAAGDQVKVTGTGGAFVVLQRVGSVVYADFTTAGVFALTVPEGYRPALHADVAFKYVTAVDYDSQVPGQALQVADDGNVSSLTGDVYLYGSGSWVTADDAPA